MDLDWNGRELRIEKDGAVSFHTIKMLCAAPAPLVVNGAPYVGCQLGRDHEGDHEVKITWAR